MEHFISWKIVDSELSIGLQTHYVMTHKNNAIYAIETRKNKKIKHKWLHWLEYDDWFNNKSTLADIPLKHNISPFYIVLRHRSNKASRFVCYNIEKNYDAIKLEFIIETLHLAWKKSI